MINDVNICVGNLGGGWSRWTIWKRGLLTSKCKQTSDEDGEGEGKSLVVVKI